MNYDYECSEFQLQLAEHKNNFKLTKLNELRRRMKADEEKKRLSTKYFKTVNYFND